MAEEKQEKKQEKKQESLVDEACSAYAIDPKFVLASNVVDGEAVIVTSGGSKVRYRKGDTVLPLHPIRVTGVNPENARRKPIAGKEKGK